ncbi:Glycine--tRNA ligase beta subunit [Bienertia sinuspersici]
MGLNVQEMLLFNQFAGLVWWEVPLLNVMFLDIKLPLILLILSLPSKISAFLD